MSLTASEITLLTVVRLGRSVTMADLSFPPDTDLSHVRRSGSYRPLARFDTMPTSDPSPVSRTIGETDRVEASCFVASSGYSGISQEVGNHEFFRRTPSANAAARAASEGRPIIFIE
jgi:hypothetical protein